MLGPVQLRRPYYLCADCSTGQYPADVELDIAGLESSPGVRRMEAVVGSEMPFVPGCEPMKLLAGLDVTAKAIERAAEAIGAEIAQRDEQEIGRAKQLVLPIVSKQNIPKMYVLRTAYRFLSWPPKPRDEPVGSRDSAPAHASASSDACSRKPPWMRRAGPCATSIPQPT